jgi:hypothetical protein
LDTWRELCTALCMWHQSWLPHTKVCQSGQAEAVLGLSGLDDCLHLWWTDPASPNTHICTFKLMSTLRGPSSGKTPETQSQITEQYSVDISAKTAWSIWNGWRTVSKSTAIHVISTDHVWGVGSIVIMNSPDSCHLVHQSLQASASNQQQRIPQIQHDRNPSTYRTSLINIGALKQANA